MLVCLVNEEEVNRVGLLPLFEFMTRHANEHGKRKNLRSEFLSLYKKFLNLSYCLESPEIYWDTDCMKFFLWKTVGYYIQKTSV